MRKRSKGRSLAESGPFRWVNHLATPTAAARRSSNRLVLKGKAVRLRRWCSGASPLSFGTPSPTAWIDPGSAAAAWRATLPYRSAVEKGFDFQDVEDLVSGIAPTRHSITDQPVDRPIAFIEDCLELLTAQPVAAELRAGSFHSGSVYDLGIVVHDATFDGH
jgi:hypothetical protein